MNTKIWLSIMAASMLALGCSDDSNTPNTPTDNPGTTDNPNQTGQTGQTGQTDQSGTPVSQPGTGIEPDYPEQPAVPDIDDGQFDESLLDGARKLSDNIINIYYKSKDDTNYGDSIQFADMSKLPKDFDGEISSEYVIEGSASAKWNCKGANSRIYFFKKSTPMDLTPYKAIGFWMYVPEDAVGKKFQIYISSSTINPTPAYTKYVTMEKSGWNYVVFELSQFKASKDMKGWDTIVSFLLYQNGTDKFTIYINDPYLYTDILDAGLTKGILPTKLDGALFTMNGSRAIIENQLIKNSFKNDDSIVYQDGKSPVYQKGKELWLPLNVIGARYDKEAVYNDTSHIMRMTFEGQTYIYQANKNTVIIDGTAKELDFKVGLNGDSLFAPMSYIKKLLGYEHEYFDSMGMVYFYNNENPLENYEYRQRLNTAHETLFSRPTGERILSDMDKMLGGDVHPRVILKKEDFDRIIDAYNNGNDNSLNNDIKKIFNSSVKGNNSTYVWEAMMNGMAYRLTGDIKYIEKFWPDVEKICNFTKWTKQGVKENGDQTATQAIGEFVIALSIAYDWMYDGLTEDQKSMIESNILKQAFNPELDSRKSSNKSICAQSKNSAVSNTMCNAAFIVGAITFANVKGMREIATELLDHSIRHIEQSFYEYTPDGGTIAHPRHGNMAKTNLYYLIATLDSAIGTNYGLFYTPGYLLSPKSAIYMESAAGCWNYNEGDSTLTFDKEYLPWFAKKLNDPTMNRAYRNYLAYKTLINYDTEFRPYPLVYWYDPKLDGDTDGMTLDAHYEQLETMVMHSSWHAEHPESEGPGFDINSIMTGIHGGLVSESDLGIADTHNWDVGKFIIYSGTQRFILDLSQEYYEYGDKSGEFYRYTKPRLYRRRAEGQNTLVIGEATQTKTIDNGDVTTKVIATPGQISGAFSKLLRSDSNDKSAIGIVDMAPAYEQVTEGQRGLFFKNNRSVIVVQDEIQLSSSEIVRWSAHTKHQITISNDKRRATLCSASDATKPCLYAEIVSSDQTLKFDQGPAKSFDPNYEARPKETVPVKDVYKIMVVTDKKVDKFNMAVAFKVVQPDEIKDDVKISETGKLYTWTNMSKWKLE